MATPHFERVGPHTELNGKHSVRKTGEGHSFSLSPRLTGGSASAAFRLDFAPEPGSSDTFGVFPADLALDSDILAATGKRCALQTWVGLDGSGRALLLCDGIESHRHDGLRWARGDIIDVKVVFGSASASVSFGFKGRTHTVVLQDVPLVANSDVASASEASQPAGTACDKYRGDISNFGYCKCGRPKSEHAPS